MTQKTFLSQLYLLVPWDLPLEQDLSEVHQVKLSQALKQLLQALEEPSHQKALMLIEQELANLDLDGVFPATSSTTKTPLKSWEVQDFDQYFMVSHVKTPEPAFCVVWSLLAAYQNFLMLDGATQSEAQQSPSPFDPTQVKQLKAGLKSYAYLLVRVFRLSLEEIS